MAPTVAQAAPLFPDQNQSHWANDAVASLAAQGLITGYPDGTFKGDRAITRWEVAMIVARLLSKMETAQATFLTKAQLQEVRDLARALQDELSALGVRVTNIEEKASQLDKRVSELERITFYGSVEARVVAQTFSNDGNVDNDNQRRGTGARGVPYLDYNNLVGSAAGATIRPQATGAVPVVDYRYGKALANGAGFTSKATLGLKIKVSPDVDAGAEFVAFTSQGNQVVDGYQGVSAPWLLNPFTANLSTSLAAEGQNHTPLTSMVLDHAWVVHKPSKIKLRLGSIDTLSMDKFVFQGQPNLGIYGPKVFPGFGFRLTGEDRIFDSWDINWEAFATKIGGAYAFLGLNYQQICWGADVSFKHPLGESRINFARYLDDSDGTNPLGSGLLGNATNVPYGAASTFYPVQWVNPPGYFAGQSSNLARAGSNVLPTTVDNRPIAGWNPAADNAIGFSGGGNFGPQASTIIGTSSNYNFNLNDDLKLTLRTEGANSVWKPNRNSTYTSSGNLLKGELGLNFVPHQLEFSVGYLSVDPNYNPVLQPGNLLGVRFVRTWNHLGRFTVHDSVNYPHNRQGIFTKGSWKFAGLAKDSSDEGSLSWKANFFEQKKTSLYDVRVPRNGDGLGTPTQAVLGFSPGYIDSVFAGFASRYQYGATSSSSFDDQLNPLENPRGQATDLGFGGYYQWDNKKFRLDWSYEHSSWYRPSGLSASLGGSQNQVDLKTDYALLGFAWKMCDPATLRLSGEYVRAHGHHDPIGLYNGYAVSSGSINFKNIDSTQWIPGIGVDYQLSKNSSFSTDLRYFSTKDAVSVPAGANPGSIGLTSNPFSWSGLQVMTSYQMSF